MLIIFIRSYKPFVMKIRKRKFLLAVFGLFGTLPFFQFFSQWKYKNLYFFYAQFFDKNASEELNSYTDVRYLGINYVGEAKDLVFQALNNKMLSQKKMLKKNFIASKNKVSYFYVFDSKSSFLEWSEEIEKNNLFPVSILPQKLKYSQKKGFLFRA